MGNLATPITIGSSASANITPASRAGSAFASLVVRDLEGVVSRAVKAARAHGRDYMAQSRAAATAVMLVRPELSESQALSAVERLRRLAFVS